MRPQIRHLALGALLLGAAGLTGCVDPDLDGYGFNRDDNRDVRSARETRDTDRDSAGRSERARTSGDRGAGGGNADDRAVYGPEGQPNDPGKRVDPPGEMLPESQKGGTPSGTRNRSDRDGSPDTEVNGTTGAARPKLNESADPENKAAQRPQEEVSDPHSPRIQDRPAPKPRPSDPSDPGQDKD